MKAGMRIVKERAVKEHERSEDRTGKEHERSIDRTGKEY